MSSRVLRSDNAVIFGMGGYDFFRISQDNRPVLQLRRLVGATATTVFEAHLPPLPVAGGAPWVHPRQARPLWDVIGECVYFTDGSSGTVSVVNIAKGVTASVDVAIPGGGSTGDPDMSDVLRSAGMPPNMPGPTAPARIIDMIVHPERRIWLHLSRRSTGEQLPVLRVSIPDGLVEKLEMPGWPRAFGRAGDFYAVEELESRVLRITRFLPRP